MPPKGSKKAKSGTPPTIKQAQADLALTGVNIEDLSPDVMAEKLGASKMRDLFSSMRAHLQKHQPAVYTTYLAQTSKSDADKRAWLARFIIVPESGGCTAESENKVSHIDAEQETEQWVTLDMLGGPSFLNNPEHAHIMVLEMESRPFKKSTALAANVVLEYKRTTDTKRMLRHTAERARL